MNVKALFLIASAGTVLLGPGIPTASAQQTIRYGTRRQPLEGRRYETMRALAHYLDETAQAALQSAVGDARGRSGRGIVPQLRDFARRADDFHRQMDNYEASRTEIPPRVDDLMTRARRVNERLNASYAGQNAQQDWDNVIDVLDRMKRVMAGQNVEVPMAHGGFEDYDRDYGPFRDTRGGVARTGDTGRPVIGLSGYRLDQFRQLARELDANALRAHQVAETNPVSYTPRQREFLADLRRFAERARDVRSQADADVVNPRDIGPIVNDLLRDARETDRSLRETRVFPQVWDQWTRTIDVLNRMTELVRY